MVIEITNPGKTLVALALAKTRLSTRYNEIVNCSSCSAQLRDTYKDAVDTITNLVDQINKGQDNETAN